MQRKDLRILIVLVLLSYIISMALTWPTDRPLPPPEATRTPWPTFASVEPSPVARILAPTGTARPTPTTRVTSLPSRAPSTPTTIPSPTATASPSPTAPVAVTHVVRAGENLTGIALRYGITVQAIVEANGLNDPDRLLLGQVLIIPLPATTSLPSAAVTPSPTAPVDVAYVVRAGDNLTSIAQQFGITVEALVKANGLTDPDRLFPDQVLMIPLAGEP